MTTQERSGERLTAEKEQGWMNVWQLNEQRWKGATQQVVDLIDKVRVDDYKGIKRIFFNKGDCLYTGSMNSLSVMPVQGLALKFTQEELGSAPVAIKRIMRDIGVQSTDEISLELINGYNGLTITIRPNDITNGKVGITLSTIEGRGGVIAPAYAGSRGDETPTMGHFPFVVPSSYRERKGEQGEKAKDIRFAYSRITGGRGSDPSFYSLHPDMIEIMTSTANWLPSLIAARKKPAS